MATPRLYIVAATIPSLREGVSRMLAAAELVAITERIAVCRDSTDDKFLELAVNGHADQFSLRHQEADDIIPDWARSKKMGTAERAG